MGPAMQLKWQKDAVLNQILKICLGYYLLCLQVVSYKVLLQFLIGIIDTELLQVVLREGFKAINIQQTWKECGEQGAGV